MTIEHVIADFKAYSQSVLDEQKQSLDNYTNNNLLDSKLVRLKNVNAYLKELKHKLNEKIEAILSENTSSIERKELDRKLRSISTEYINEYMASSFIKK
jgi:hypothetical protein